MFLKEFQMLKTLRNLLLIVMAAALTLSAADAMLGTWKLNTAKSKYSPGPGPQSVTATYSQDGDWVVVKTEGVGPDGKAATIDNRYKRDGKEYPYQAPTGGSGTIIAKSKGANTTDATLKVGSATTTSHTVVAKDGKSFTRTTKGTNAEGKPVNNTAVYEKQ
jgi:hypothetical protein